MTRVCLAHVPPVSEVHDVKVHVLLAWRRLTKGEVWTGALECLTSTLAAWSELSGPCCLEPQEGTLTGCHRAPRGSAPLTVGELPSAPAVRAHGSVSSSGLTSHRSSRSTVLRMSDLPLLLPCPHLLVLAGGVRQEVLCLLEGPKTVPSDFCLFHVADSWGLSHLGPAPHQCLPWRRTGARVRGYNLTLQMLSFL